MQRVDKGFYDKKIVYLDYLERGEKIKNGGFLKWEMRGEDSRIQIHIRGLYPTDTLSAKIELLSFEKTYYADSLSLRYGTGEYAALWKNEDLAGTGLACAEWDGVCVRLSDTRTLRGKWRERGQAEIKTAQDSSEKAELMSAEETKTEIQKATRTEIQTEIQTKIWAEDKVERVENMPSAEPQTVPAVSAAVEQVKEETEIPPKGIVLLKKPEKSAMPEKMAETISSDKWEELCKLYPTIHPFGDARAYLSITPRDFILLAREYQNLVQNSFLLHGYYNYGHVILTKLREKGAEQFYLGVPGVYFDRERQAALMFGFEGFEPGSGETTEGGFGYYMKRVEI